MIVLMLVLGDVAEPRSRAVRSRRAGEHVRSVLLGN
jgi:hypothetical protein